MQNNGLLGYVKVFWAIILSTRGPGRTREDP